jgi:hypothetical protein
MYDWYERICFQLLGLISFLFKALKSEDQLIASSDLIEFEWYKEPKMEGLISITVQLTRHFDLYKETNDDLQKRRRKAQSNKIFQCF